MNMDRMLFADVGQLTNVYTTNKNYTHSPHNYQLLIAPEEGARPYGYLPTHDGVLKGLILCRYP